MAEDTFDSQDQENTLDTNSTAGNPPPADQSEESVGTNVPMGHSGLPIEMTEGNSTSDANPGVPTVKPSLVDKVVKKKHRFGAPEESGNPNATLAESGPDGGEAPESVDESGEGEPEGGEA